MGFIDGIKLLLFKPEIFFKRLEKESWKQSLVFVKPMVVVGLLAGFVIALARALGLPENLQFLLAPTIVSYFFQAFILVAVAPEILHACLAIKQIGGKATEEKTKQAYFYAFGIFGLAEAALVTVSVLLLFLAEFLEFDLVQSLLLQSPIGIINLVFVSLLFYSSIKGIALLHKISKLKVFAAIVLAAVVLFIILILGGLFILGITGAQYALEHPSKFQPKTEIKQPTYSDQATQKAEQKNSSNSALSRAITTLGETGITSSVEGIVRLIEEFPSGDGDVVLLAMKKGGAWDINAVEKAVALDNDKNLVNFEKTPPFAGLFKNINGKNWQIAVRNAGAKQYVTKTQIKTVLELSGFQLNNKSDNTIVVNFTDGTDLSNSDLESVTIEAFSDGVLPNIDRVIFYNQRTGTVMPVQRPKE